MASEEKNTKCRDVSSKSLDSDMSHITKLINEKHQSDLSSLMDSVCSSSARTGELSKMAWRRNMLRASFLRDQGKFPPVQLYKNSYVHIIRILCNVSLAAVNKMDKMQNRWSVATYRT